MAYIDYISDEDASQELKALYDHHRTDGDGVDNILRIHGPNPPSMEVHFGLYRTLMIGKSPLSRRQREMIAVVVAAAIGCHY